MARSKLDSLYRRMLITRFFEKGWGTPENLQRLFEFRKVISNRESCYRLVPDDYPINIFAEKKYVDHTLLEGKFKSPLELHMPGVVPKEAQEAYFQILLPTKWKHERHKPMCIHLAGTGDHFFWRRRKFIAKPLLNDANIGAIILENPFYGLRKPSNQVRSNLHNVSDIFVMGGCLIMECLVLLHWCERNGLGPLGVTGLSMGGHMASLAATNWPKPLVLVPCLSWSTASTVFTTGVMSQSINWDMLETQYYSDGKYSERLSKMVTVIDDAFEAGQKFMKDFRQSLKELRRDIKDTKQVQDLLQQDDGRGFVSADGDPTPNEAIPGKIERRLLGTANSIERVQQQCTNSGEMVKQASTSIKIVSGNGFNLTRLMQYILPQAGLHRQSEKIDITKTNWWEREALQFMRGMMDECTHLKNFSVPYDTSLIIAVCAKDDAYVPRDGCTSLEDIWPGAEVRYLDAGHVSAYILHQKLFRSCIVEAFEKAMKLYDNEQKEQDIIQSTALLKPTITYQQLLNKYANTV